MRQRRHTAGGLSGRDEAVLALERKWGPSPDAMAMKLQEAREELGLSSGGYGLVLNGLLDDPEAMAADPQTVTALRAIRDSRRAGLQSPTYF